LSERFSKDRVVTRVGDFAWTAVVGAWVLVSVLGCAPQKSTQPPNVFIILVDTLRADRVGAFGAVRELTPTFDSVAETSYVFQKAYSSSSWTSPAVASLFTSRYPSQHQVVDFDSVLAPEELSLAESLSERGYHCGGFSASALVSPTFGFDQGFEVFESRGVSVIGGREYVERTSNTARRALRWIDDRRDQPKRPLFVYMHLMDPHIPYAPRSGAVEQVFAERQGPDTRHVNRLLKKHLSNPIVESMRDDVRGLYDAEVNSFDTDLESFLRALEERDLLENSILVITSDHGEELWDHGRFGHHHTLHDELLHVPLLIRAPYQTVGYEVTEPISLLDIAPTLLDLLKLPPVEQFEGRSLTSSMRSRFEKWVDWFASPDQSSRSDSIGIPSELILPPSMRHTAHERSLIIGDIQLIRDFDGAEHFFELGVGTAEPSASDSAVSASEKEALRSALDGFVARVTEQSRRRKSGSHIILDQQSRRELRALGYIE